MQEIINACECGVFLRANEYRDYYDSIEQGVEDSKLIYQSDYEGDLKQRMLKTKEIICLKFYPDTPVGFYVVYGTTVDEVINKAKKILNI